LLWKYALRCKFSPPWVPHGPKRPTKV